ncbi:DNA repair ATPase [Oceanirhabdus sp. W0125-5]|uniref:DNA repair ATPase n=1 Tax=Oceanirhabdus sp. W0125-5 TaxID=2999116 RepID=UPI0022F316D0|nr:DNA repair ATPase [Oceanirhabdus sp. W0125-5]WBW95191.1 DNA repair ATPase [Oceanirhabdus sp. W0125-5]
MGVKENKDKQIKNKDMENSTYEVIKNRLTKHGDDLKERVESLNAVRKEVFGSIESKLLSSERIITENNCIPRDMAPVDDYFIFGYNVHIGLKSKVELSDVFSVYKYKDHTFQKQTFDLINDDQFLKDFDDLYKYYKNTFFAKFTIIEPYFYMIFQTGKNATDIKAFKWLIEGDKLKYVDCRSEHEVKFVNKNEFNFVKATRDDQRSGLYPHVSIQDKVFVETLNGDLTIKVEDNTEVGKGIYSEDVEDKDQNLDDAEIFYADLGEIVILKIRPYKEKDYRYFVFNNKLKNVVRIDSIKDTCMLLPGNHGLIFPKGYYLQSGEYKIFDVPCEDSVFDQMISSSNGEDYQYIFYNIDSGIYLVYSYNIIEQTIDTPIVCSGYSHFNNGEMIVFKHENEPRKNHMIQIWQTPYVGKNYVSEGHSDSILFNIGNKDIVNCMADCKIVFKLIQKGEGYQSIYIDIVKESEQIIDTYFWIDKEEAYNLKEVLLRIKETSSFAIGEFEKVVRIKNATKKQIDDVKNESEELLKKLEYGTFDTVDEYVKVLAEIRNLRGKIVSLRDLRYTDLEIVDSLDTRVKEKNEEFSNKCVEFLIQPEGLKIYADKVQELQSAIDMVNKSKEGKELTEKMDETSSDLELLIDIVSNFKIEDPTMTTQIIEKISSLFSLINNAKARLKTRVEEFSKSEMTTQFNSQMKLLSQAVVNYLDVSDTVEKCDQYLNKVMVQIQELEGKFAEFDEYVVKLSEKREELYNAFEGKKQSLLDKLNKRIVGLFNSSERIINGIANRVKGFNSIEEINGYLATDIMAEKVRDIISQLRELGDNVKADEISSRLKTLKEDTIRQLKDKQELYVGGENVLKLGKHHFSVNTKAIDLSMVQKDDGLYYHITGTDFWDKVVHEEINKYQHVFEQSIVSENVDVYRGEYLAYTIFKAARNKQFESLDILYSKTETQLVEIVQKFMESRYQEGYTKGVHDSDGAKILKTLLELHHNIDLLIYKSQVRALARLFWKRLVDSETKELLIVRLKELAKVSLYFNSSPNLDNYLPFIIEKLNNAYKDITFFDNKYIPAAAEYLCKEIMKGEEFVVSKEAKKIYDGFMNYLRDKNAIDQFSSSVKNSINDIEGVFYLIKEWVNAYRLDILDNSNLFEALDKEELSGVLDEVIVMLIENNATLGRVINVDTKVTINGLVGTHGVINGGKYTIAYTKFMHKLKHYSDFVVNDYLKFQNIKKELIQQFKDELHLDDFKPKVLSSFVRNKLIDKVYLPLIGDNLAKQIGVVGENKRTDLMGMLLLVSPPGYGKTTLMEYIASRLGIILVKINGPSLGHEVTSLDPGKANNTSARDELRKLNLALKMGNNVMIYVDDIQHCNPEFLQKFISLCDGQRKIEGVYNGVGQTYDLRGKKVAVVMAGNPYTESGEKFKIPDMLSNRADVYNLGDMLRENEEAFKLSYIENSLTSNPVLSKLSSRSQKDLYGLIEMAKGAERENVNFEGTYSIDELNEYITVIEKLFKVRDVVLKVNMEYIYSAAQADEYRNEPPFKLQGSYRNMNKIAEKVVSIMNDEELFEQILASYVNDSQTLTTGAEANMLKWKEIAGCLNSEEKERWDEIKKIFVKNKLVKGDDKIGQAVMVLSNLTENLEMIKDIMAKSKDIS